MKRNSNKKTTKQKNNTKNKTEGKKSSNTKDKTTEKLENNNLKTILTKTDQNVKTNDPNEMRRLIKIIVVITIIMVVMYLVTMIATYEADAVKEVANGTTTVADIQYDYIMIGTMLNKGGTYYVLIEQDGDNRVIEYETLMQVAQASEDAPTIYTANLTDIFNKSYLAKESNYYVDNIKDFKVTGTTLVKIVDGKITTVCDTYDDIKEKLNSLA